HMSTHFSLVHDEEIVPGPPRGLLYLVAYLFLLALRHIHVDGIRLPATSIGTRTVILARQGRWGTLHRKPGAKPAKSSIRPMDQHRAEIPRVVGKRSNNLKPLGCINSRKINEATDPDIVADGKILGHNRGPFPATHFLKAIEARRVRMSYSIHLVIGFG